MLQQGHFILQMDIKELCLIFGQVAKFKSHSHHPGTGDVTEADLELNCLKKKNSLLAHIFPAETL